MGRGAIDKVADPLLDIFLAKSTPDILLAQVKRNAFVDVLQQTDSGKNLDTFLDEYLSEYKAEDDPWAADPKGKEQGLMHITNGKITRGVARSRRRPVVRGAKVEMEVLAAGQKWMMMVRIYHNPQTKCFYILAPTPAPRLQSK